jgi:ketosteroid isomerase-like protein
MSDNADLALVRSLYDSGMAPEVTAEIISPDLVWDITPGFPSGGVYRGWESVGRDFLGSLMPNFASFGAVPEQFFADDEGHVFVTGHYHGETKSGNTADVRFVHFWTVRDSKLVHLVQTADSHVLQQAVNG